jgi:hypothetical protein
VGAWDVQLSTSLIQRLDQVINERTVVGGRYGAQSESEVDTERF